MISTHKLGYSSANGKFYVYPFVQKQGDSLIDFSNPKYGKWDAFDNAIKNKDYIELDSEEKAKQISTKYKDYFKEYFDYFK